MISLSSTYEPLLSKKNLSICMISDDFLPAMTGVGVYLKLVAPELVKRGHKVSVITSRRKGEPAVEQWQGVTIYRVFTIKMYGFYQALPSAAKVREILNLVNPDVVHHHYVGFMMKLVCKIAESMKMCQVSTYHFGPEILTQPLPMRPFRGIIRKLMVNYNNRCAMVMAPSQNVKKQIIKDGVKSPIQYITNPVAFGEKNNVVPAERTSGYTILYAGRLGKEKNIEYLIRSFSLLLSTRPNAILWIAGRGPELSALENLCSQLKISNSVKFLGFLEHKDLARYYAACDTFVLPSLQEVQPLVVMEAMWFAKPVIVTNAIAAAEEMVDHGVNGFIVDPNSVEDLTKRFLELSSDPITCITFGEESRKRAEMFRPELVVNAIELAYFELVESAAKTIGKKANYLVPSNGALASTI